MGSVATRLLIWSQRHKMAAVYVGLGGQGGKWCHRLVDFGFWHDCAFHSVVCLPGFYFRGPVWDYKCGGSGVGCSLNRLTWWIITKWISESVNRGNTVQLYQVQKSLKLFLFKNYFLLFVFVPHRFPRFSSGKSVTKPSGLFEFGCFVSTLNKFSNKSDFIFYL